MQTREGSNWKVVDPNGLGRRLVELLRIGPETTIELQLLRDGSVRALKLEEETHQ